MYKKYIHIYIYTHIHIVECFEVYGLGWMGWHGIRYGWKRDNGTRSNKPLGTLRTACRDDLKGDSRKCGAVAPLTSLL